MEDNGIPCRNIGYFSRLFFFFKYLSDPLPSMETPLFALFKQPTIFLLRLLGSCHFCIFVWIIEGKSTILNPPSSVYKSFSPLIQVLLSWVVCSALPANCFGRRFVSTLFGRYRSLTDPKKELQHSHGD